MWILAIIIVVLIIVFLNDLDSYLEEFDDVFQEINSKESHISHISDE